MCKTKDINTLICGKKKRKFYRQKRGSPSAAEIVSVFLPNNPQM
jgi:hypothetical protein